VPVRGAIVQRLKEGMRRGKTTSFRCGSLTNASAAPVYPPHPISRSILAFTAPRASRTCTHACAMTSHMSLGVTVTARRNCPSSFFELDLLKQQIGHQSPQL
jgi:hypothetical protein